MKTLQELLEQNDYEPEEYSGRGMFGKTCLSTTLPRGERSVRIMAKLAMAIVEADDLDQDDKLSILEDMADAKEDSMGRGTVVYWPSIPFIESDEDEDEEE